MEKRVTFLTLLPLVFFFCSRQKTVCAIATKFGDFSSSFIENTAQNLELLAGEEASPGSVFSDNLRPTSRVPTFATDRCR